MLDIVKADLLKLKNVAWLLMVIGPLGVVAMQGGNYAARFDELVSMHPDNGSFLLENIHTFWPPALLLGITLLISLFASIEHQTNTWTKLFSLPVKAGKIYLSKLIIIVGILMVSSLLLVLASFLLGTILGFSIYWLEAIMMSFYTLFATMPFLLIQFWLSLYFVNQGIALTIGIANAVFSMYAVPLPDWMPWKWPLLLEGFENGAVNGALGLGLGVILLCLTFVHLTRRDVT